VRVITGASARIRAVRTNVVFCVLIGAYAIRRATTCVDHTSILGFERDYSVVLVSVDSVRRDVPVVDIDSVDPLKDENQQDHNNEVLPAFQLCDGNSTPNARGLLEEVDPANNVPPNSEEK